MGKYDDIIHMEHPTSKVHPRMPMQKRAAQFSPFAALQGYEEAVQEAQRRTEEEIDLDEHQKELLDFRLQQIQHAGFAQCPVSITYFEPDQRKEGGKYVEISGHIQRIDRTEHCLQMEDGMRIPMRHIVRIESRVFRGEEDF